MMLGFLLLILMIITHAVCLISFSCILMILYLYLLLHCMHVTWSWRKEGGRENRVEKEEEEGERNKERGYLWVSGDMAT